MLNIVKVIDNGLTYKVKWEEEDGFHLANIGEYTKECEGIRAAREFIRKFNNNPIRVVLEEE